MVFPKDDSSHLYIKEELTVDAAKSLRNVFYYIEKICDEKKIFSYRLVFEGFSVNFCHFALELYEFISKKKYIKICQFKETELTQGPKLFSPSKKFMKSHEDQKSFFQFLNEESENFKDNYGDVDTGPTLTFDPDLSYAERVKNSNRIFKGLIPNRKDQPLYGVVRPDISFISNQEELDEFDKGNCIFSIYHNMILKDNEEFIVTFETFQNKFNK